MLGIVCDSKSSLRQRKEKWIKDYVARETPVGRKHVEDAETAIKQEQQDIGSAECGGLTAREPRKLCEEMLDATGDSLSDLASSDNEENGEDDEDTEQVKQSEDDEHGWVMGTISKAVKQRMERFQETQINLDELRQPGWGDMADYFRERDTRYGVTELKFPAVVKLYKVEDAAHPALSTFGELMESLDIIPGILQIPHGTSQPGSSHVRQGSGRLQ